MDMEAPNIPKKGVMIGIVILVVLAGIFYFFFIRSDEGSDGGGNGDGKMNRSPFADAGLDMTVEPGEIFYLNGSGSYDIDGDPLTYFWDMDIGKDTNNDGINDNDKDREGVNVTFSYPSSEETVEYIVTLNVSDGKLWDKSTVKITVIIRGEDEGPPEITFSCRYQAPPLGLPGDPQFIITVNSVSRNESFTDFIYALEDPDGNVLYEGTVVELINLSQEDLIRFVDTPEFGDIDENDIFTFRETGTIIEGCTFYLFYLYEIEPAGSIEFTK